MSCERTWWTWIWHLGLGSLLISLPAAAEMPVGRSVEQVLVEPEAREQLFNELAEEVAQLERRGNLLKKVVKLATPSVVHLETWRTDADSSRFGRQPTIEEAGSGIIAQFHDRFYVLTNRHVVAGATLDRITVRLHNGRRVTPVQLWSDAESDVAVIRLRETNLVPARLGVSDLVEIGDFVLAVGSPFGLSHSVSYGIISAKGRRDLQLGTDEVRLQNFLQTDAAINPGNSGGPLLNLRGEVIGMNTAIASNSGGNEGVSFAIPIKMVVFAARQLIENGRVQHAYLGVQLDSRFDDELARQLGLQDVRGALVKGITPKSPAYFANLKNNDVILSYNGVVVEDDDHLVNLVSMTPIDSTVTIEILRDRQPLELEVRVGNRRQFEPAE